ncbi:MAG: hypothetical protein HQ446_11825 [Polaromonas sp.]|nr:hypothetical protein [Polaromonas sp.]
MATAKTIATSAAPAAPAANTTPVKSVTVKTVTAKPVTPKQPAKKAAPRKAVAKKPAAKKPLSKAFAPVKATKTLNPVKTTKAVKVEKPKKPKLIRDSFTIPKVEYVVLEALKQRATKLTRAVKKSELLRASIKALAAMSDAAFLSALEKVPAIKTGRPASAK